MASIVRGLSRLPNKTVVYRGLSSSAVYRSIDGKNVDIETHTGQVWDKDDYRRARFVDKSRLVNTRFAIDLIAEDPVVVCTQRVVSSNSGGPLGHPKVFINLDRPEVAVCGYSGRKFILKKYYKEAEHGPSITFEQYLEEMEREKS